MESCLVSTERRLIGVGSFEGVPFGEARRLGRSCLHSGCHGKVRMVFGSSWLEKTGGGLADIGLLRIAMPVRRSNGFEEW